MENTVVCSKTKGSRAFGNFLGKGNENQVSSAQNSPERNSLATQSRTDGPCVRLVHEHCCGGGIRKSLGPIRELR